jgi:hypothetical protein
MLQLTRNQNQYVDNNEYLPGYREVRKLRNPLQYLPKFVSLAVLALRRRVNIKQGRVLPVV